MLIMNKFLNNKIKVQKEKMKNMQKGEYSLIIKKY